MPAPFGQNSEMRRFRPVHGVVIVLLVIAAILTAELALEGKLKGESYELVKPGRDGMVEVGLQGLGPQQVRFYRFLNRGNQEVKFFVGRDAQGQLQVAFDADEVCAKGKRGFRHEGEWMVCNKCDKAFRLSQVNEGGGGCKPVPVAFRQDGDRLLIAEADVLNGWRLFR